MPAALRALPLLLCLAGLPALAAPPAPCTQSVKQGRSGGLISFQSEAHARELLVTEAGRYCRDLGEPAITDIRCAHDAPREQAVVSSEGGKPLVLERRARWYCSGEIRCALPEKRCGTAAPAH
jgi:hypothetical protein